MLTSNNEDDDGLQWLQTYKVYDIFGSDKLKAEKELLIAYTVTFDNSYVRLGMVSYLEQRYLFIQPIVVFKLIISLLI